MISGRMRIRVGDDIFPKPITPGKGLRGENCNVTHCQKPNSAEYFHATMRAWYCKKCALRLERVARSHGMSFFHVLSKEMDDARS